VEAAADPPPRPCPPSTMSASARRWVPHVTRARERRGGRDHTTLPTSLLCLYVVVGVRYPPRALPCIRPESNAVPTLCFALLSPWEWLAHRDPCFFALWPPSSSRWSRMLGLRRWGPSGRRMRVVQARLLPFTVSLAVFHQLQRTSVPTRCCMSSDTMWRLPPLHLNSSGRREECTKNKVTLPTPV